MCNMFKCNGYVSDRHTPSLLLHFLRHLAVCMCKHTYSLCKSFLLLVW